MQNYINRIKAFFPLETWENSKTLRAKNEKVDIFDDEIQEFCDILIELMYGYDGVGLAAPQVGKNIRMIATTQRKEERKGYKNKRTITGETVMINPEIIEHSEDTKIGEEACLSVPGVCGDVERWIWIVVRYQDKKGKQHTQKYSGFSAVVIQHEMDHLEGILFTDKAIGKLRKIDKKSDY